jgi:diketogulonate reductase-like aldo/keto reductase
MKMNSIFALSSLVLLSTLVQGKNNMFSGFTKNNDGLLTDVPKIKLSNGSELPLIGLGVGNLQKNRIENMIYEGLKSDHRIHLIDTAHASGNEKEVARGITTGIKRFKETKKLDDRIQVHVVTKVWYTHLGYERTKISVKESLNDLADAIKDPDVDLHVHFLIHWPKCNDGIEWMNCEEEENSLPANVKNAGPAPHLDKANAWKGSWKALEDMYNSADYPAIAGIGISNFGTDELEELVQMARVVPHIIQMNVWSLLNDPPLVDVCNRNNISIQLFNVMNGILGHAFNTPYAYHHLLMVANQLQTEASTEIPHVTPAQVILKWLVQSGMSVVPRTSNMDRLQENSAVSLSAIPELNDEKQEIVAHAVDAILAGQDVDEDVHLKVTFHAKSQDMYLFFYPGEDGIEVQIAHIPKGESVQESTHPNHQFRLYDAYDPDVYRTITVQGAYGEEVDIHVEL